LNQVANEGYNVILSSPWYLNYISYGKYNTITSVMNLEFFKYYEVEPFREFNGKIFVEYIVQFDFSIDFVGSNEARERILGGEACMWGEFVDGTNLLPRLWPKASAVAERLWSDASVNNSEDAQFRLVNFVLFIYSFGLLITPSPF
jgi:hexosaminidase